MEDRAKPGFTEAISAAIDWWRDAGVDCDFHDEPARWLSPADETPDASRPREGGHPGRKNEPASGGEPRFRGEAVAATPSPQLFDAAALPQDLAAFTEWWMSEPKLDGGRIAGRVPPRGNPGADFMVIVPDPERDDGDTLLSGPQGKLLAAMLAAMQIAPERVYVASVLPRPMPMPDWSSIERHGFGAVLAHHIALAAPKRLIALGSNILPLLGNDPAHNPAVLRTFNQQGGSIPLLAGKSLAALIERPRWKAGLWQGWLDWTAA